MRCVALQLQPTEGERGCETALELTVRRNRTGDRVGVGAGWKAYKGREGDGGPRLRSQQDSVPAFVCRARDVAASGVLGATGFLPSFGGTVGSQLPSGRYTARIQSIRRSPGKSLETLLEPSRRPVQK